jgi:hypothetical protein
VTHACMTPTARLLHSCTARSDGARVCAKAAGRRGEHLLQGVLLLLVAVAVVVVVVVVGVGVVLVGVLFGGGGGGVRVGDVVGRFVRGLGG